MPLSLGLVDVRDHAAQNNTMPVLLTLLGPFNSATF